MFWGEAEVAAYSVFWEVSITSQLALGWFNCRNDPSRKENL